MWLAFLNWYILVAVVNGGEGFLCDRGKARFRFGFISFGKGDIKASFAVPCIVELPTPIHSFSTNAIVKFA